MTPFPSLDSFAPTRQTLHLYVKAVSAIARAHAVPDDRWRHIGLVVVPSGLLGANLPLPDGRLASFLVDLHQHEIRLTVSDATVSTFDMTAGLTGSEMGDRLIAAAGDLGLAGEYERHRFAGDEPNTYEAAAARRFFTALVNAQRLFATHRAGLQGDTSGVMFWPHGFDLAFEWFGTRTVEHVENGQSKSLPAQLNLGFYPDGGDELAYFYSNPWPFEAGRLVDKPLPSGARWYTEDWAGTILPYAELVGDPDADERVRRYAQAVFDVVSPTLLA